MSPVSEPLCTLHSQTSQCLCTLPHEKLQAFHLVQPLKWVGKPTLAPQPIPRAMLVPHSRHTELFSQGALAVRWE
jgi:hypothetical protein